MTKTSPKFVPTSTSWTSLDQGWVLGFDTDDATTRPVLRHTEDGGRTWTTATAPEISVAPFSAQVRVHSTNGGNLLVTNGKETFVSHDGARCWHEVSWIDAGPDLMVGALASHDTAAYATVTDGPTYQRRTRLFTSTSNMTRWLPVPGVKALGPAAGSVVAAGNTAFAALGGGGTPGHYWTNRDGGWTTATPPCPEINQATQLALIPGDTTTVFAVCSHHAGQPGHFVKELLRSVADAPFQILGRAPLAGVTRGLAVPDPATALVSSVGGGLGMLFRSTDTGQTWETVLQEEPPALLDLAFQDANHGVVFRGSGTGDSGAVLRTTDGGATWTELNLT